MTDGLENAIHDNHPRAWFAGHFCVNSDPYLSPKVSPNSKASYLGCCLGTHVLEALPPGTFPPREAES